MQKRTLILGGAGFIGSHLADRLLKTGREVHVLDNLKYCYSGNLRDALKDKEHCFFHKFEAMDVQVFLSRQPAFDEIYHMAGVVSTINFMAEPIEAFLVAVLPIIQLLDYQRTFKETKLLFTSSSEVYGNALVLPTPENYLGNVDFCGPRSGYDEGKRSAESIIVGYRRKYGTSCARVRLFNTFGPRMRANGRLVPTMVQSALRTKEILVNQPGNQTRTLLYVSDCVEALIRAMDLQWPDPINIGGYEETTILNIAKLVAERVEALTGEKVSIEMADPLPADIYRRHPDITTAEKVLKWRPRVTIQEGIDEVIHYWMQRV